MQQQQDGDRSGLMNQGVEVCYVMSMVISIGYFSIILVYVQIPRGEVLVLD